MTEKNTDKESTSKEQSTLPFKFAPHIVEDLGLNLYTDLPRVLVEFVANAYDADSPRVKVIIDKDAIDKARAVVKQEHKLETVKDEVAQIGPLETRELPDSHTIEIIDTGHGMSKDDIAQKFLVAGRRRRKEEPESNGRTPNGRLLMGRKGLGKLAGFGVAKRVEITSKKPDEKHATMVILDFDELTKDKAINEVDVPVIKIDDGGGLGTQGTRVVLSRLLYEPVKSRPSTILKALSEHFSLVCGPSGSFHIHIGTDEVPPAAADHAYAWPEPDKPIEDLIQHSLTLEDGKAISFSYRLRFTKEGNALPATRRGVRVYAHNRLASAPSLLNADTNMHGFRMTDYMDGVVVADFIDDDDNIDYIATDRQSLRWSSPLLAPLHKFLSDEIKIACAKYQKKRENAAPNIVRADLFSTKTIEEMNFSKRDKRMAERFAVILKGACKRGIKDPEYKNKLPIFLKGIGHGNIMTAIASLADSSNPDIHRVAAEVAKLTKEEFDDFISYAKGRINAITAFEKVVKGSDFAKPENEKLIQGMFENSPWMIDPSFSQFMTADQKQSEVFDLLAKQLKIGNHATPKSINSDERSDLVFLTGSQQLKMLIIVELKSANLPLNSDHLDQLMSYMQDAKEWLEENNFTGMTIRGQLIGTTAVPANKAKKVKALRMRISEQGAESKWQVRSFLKVLDDTRNAHQELIASQKKLTANEPADDISSEQASDGSGNSSS